MTDAWCECARCAAAGRPASYARLWLEAAARFPARRVEILATGATLRPPDGVAAPGNVEVRLRPGRDGCGFHGACDRGCPGNVADAAEAWEARGARVVVEIDASPASWLGMPWPCHDAVRADARRFRAAVLRGPTHDLAWIWRDPGADVPFDPKLLERARGLHSWGDPRDAADLFLDERHDPAFRIAAIERLLRLATAAGGAVEERRSAAADAFLGYREIASRLPRESARAYRRLRGPDFRRVQEELWPQGVERTVGPAKVREAFDAITVEMDRCVLAIDARTAVVRSLRARNGSSAGEEIAGSFFSVVALGAAVDRSDGEVTLSSPAEGRLDVVLRGLLTPKGPAWRSRLELAAGSPVVRQETRVEGE
ncbi:MAG: hypothetical protein ACREID_02630, partial [Planctomycetota bacterium]